jgi:DnaJ-class molecular chaperone
MSGSNRQPRSLYELLGVPTDADAAAIKRQWKLAMQRAHPDMGGSHEEALAVQAAYEVLSDQLKHRNYDDELDRKRAEAQRHASRTTGEADDPLASAIADFFRVFAEQAAQAFSDASEPDDETDSSRSEADVEGDDAYLDFDEFVEQAWTNAASNTCRGTNFPWPPLLGSTLSRQ